tara:strand:- start:581 stop:1096 length:516 start_codon:yes stop_codon:yes gene_type:complete
VFYITGSFGLLFGGIMKKQRYKKTSTLSVGTMVQGMIGENTVANLLLKNGYIVSRPEVDLGVDMVVCKPRKWGDRLLVKKWISIQVKYHSRTAETTYGHALMVKITPNHCDYIATPINNDEVIFFQQAESMKGRRYARDFAFPDSKKMKYWERNNNQNVRRWVSDHLHLPK